ncbi:MAG: hypothetical protein RSE23_01880 [Clostridia bacterium]
MAQAYVTMCERLFAAGKLTPKLLLAYKRGGRLTQEEYDTLLAELKDEVAEGGARDGN